MSGRRCDASKEKVDTGWERDYCALARAESQDPTRGHI